jgi:hypothetical protein
MNYEDSEYLKKHIETQFEQIEFRSGVVIPFSGKQLRMMEVDYGHATAVSLRAHLYGQLVDTVTIKYPADWWQERFAPKWFLNEWPVIFVRRVILARSYINRRIESGEEFVKLSEVTGSITEVVTK